MYPFSVSPAFVRDCWYVAALSNEIGEGLLGRRILGDLVVLYRDQEGAPVALSGLCPHRRMPLHMGRKCGDSVQCGYHGIVFDKHGRCTDIPSQGKGSERLSLHRYPVAERWQFIWIWTGDPDKADPADIPDHEEMGLGEGWEKSPPEHYPVAARSQMLIENLLDLSHINYLHGNYIQDDAWCATPVKLTRGDDGRCVASRYTAVSDRSNFHEWMFANAPEKVEQDLRTVFLTPAVTYSGPVVHAAGGNGEYLGTMQAIHAITPETERSSHYFSLTTRDFRVDDQAMTEELHAMDIEVRKQDMVALAAIEQELEGQGRIPDEVSVPGDNPALQVRRIIEDMLVAEQEAVV